MPSHTFLHLVFKPVDKFEYEGCDDKDCIFCVPYEWSISPPYVELDDDDADLRDFLGEDGEQYYWVCMYLWD